MPIPTPFHDRTSELCKSLLYKDWAGYHAVRSYDTYVDREYFAIRHMAGMIDVTPLFKYEVRGRDAAAFLSHIMVRNIMKLKIGHVYYCCWCNGDGKMIDDGTVWRIDDSYFRVTSTEPNFAWFQRCASGYDVEIEDSTRRIGALSIQGPNARAVLHDAVGGDIAALEYFRLAAGNVDGVDVHVTRTGYTGDLGYELWVAEDAAVRLYDALLAAGRPHGLMPAGLDAMDITRIEAGYILNGVDYYNANHCLIESRKSTPFELGLGWMVRLKRPSFNGREALATEKRQGPKRMLVGLDIDWDEYERLYARHGLPPEISGAAWRVSIPVYNDAGEQVGYANSGSWSPILKKNLALATVSASYAAVGTQMQFEVTVEYERKTVPATVVERPFFDPERKRV